MIFTLVLPQNDIYISTATEWYLQEYCHRMIFTLVLPQNDIYISTATEWYLH